VRGSVSTVADLKKLSTNDLKAIGFKPEVRAKLQRAIAGQEPEAAPEDKEEEFVTLEEEEDAQISTESAGKGGKKKKKSKATAKPATSSNSNAPVPGEDGVAMDPEFVQLLTTLGLEGCVAVFQRNNITSLASCRYITREALTGNLGVPDDKAGLLLSHIVTSAPGVAQERRLPELGSDLAALVAAMKLQEPAREQVKTSLQTNNVLTINDAKSKRFAMMNEVGLSADAATELGRLLDNPPAYVQNTNHSPGHMAMGPIGQIGQIGQVGQMGPGYGMQQAGSGNVGMQNLAPAPTQWAAQPQQLFWNQNGGLPLQNGRTPGPPIR